MASHERRPTRRVDQDLRAIGALTQAVLDGIDVEQLLGQIATEAQTLVGAALGLPVVTVTGTPGHDEVQGRRRFRWRKRAHRLRDAGRQHAHGARVETRHDLRCAVCKREYPHRIVISRSQSRSARSLLLPSPRSGWPEGSGRRKTGRLLPFRPADIQLVSTFASQAASAIELFELRSEETALAARAERERIARDLTDTVIDALGDVELSVRALATGATDARLAAGIDVAVGQLHRAITTVRTYALELQATTVVVPTSRDARGGGARPRGRIGGKMTGASAARAARARSRPSADSPSRRRGTPPRTRFSSPSSTGWSRQSTVDRP